MESARRCRDCRRVIAGNATPLFGLTRACPYCGSDSLIDITLPRPAPLRHHPSVLTATLTFCVGLFVIRTAALALVPVLRASNPAGDLLWNLQLLVGICTLVYLVLRRIEGDFLALFIINFSMFIATECLGVLAREYGLFALHGLCMLFNIGMFIYGCLALTAAIAEGKTSDVYRRPLGAACIGFVLLAMLRIFLQTHTPAADENQITTLALLGLAIYVGRLLLRGEKLAGISKGVETQAMPVGAELLESPQSGATEE